jgi:hypothetical protein
LGVAASVGVTVRPARPARLALIAFVAVAATGGCASAVDSPDSPTSGGGAGSGTLRPPARRIAEPRAGQVGVRPIPWDRARVAADDRSLTIDFTSGVEPCYVLDDVRVRYAPRGVTVTLLEGHAPGAGDVACIEIAELKSVRVELEEPLAGRRIVDGARR